MRKALMAAGAVSLFLGVILVICGEQPEPTASIWEEARLEEVQTYIRPEEQEESIPEPEPVQECEAGESAEVPQTAAGQVNEITYEEAQLLMKIAVAEAGNQGTEGMWLVMSVVMNRVKDPDFPDTIEEVIFQKYQFSSVSDGNFDKVTDLPAEAHEALAMIEGGKIADEIIGFEVKTSEELDKYFLAAFEYRDHRFYTADFTKGD